MRRITIAERPDWRETAARCGFQFHTFDGERYWDESAYYAFSLRQIEQDLEAPTEELHTMCIDLLDRIVDDENHLRQLAIPEPFWDMIRRSWRARAPHLYGRMDFAYSGHGPAKLYELNYDTPTSIYESAFFQWLWLEQQIERGALPAHADQFNSIQEKLIDAFATIAGPGNALLHFSSVFDSLEDRGTVDYLRDCAEQAGLLTTHVAVEDVGVTEAGEFTDIDNRIIRTLFKLYPWEFMFREEFGQLLPKASTHFLEPCWKALLSNKGILPLLWQFYPNHPNLLPAFFDGEGARDTAPGWVRKPLFSREGANITLRDEHGVLLEQSGPYADAPFVRQALSPLPCFDGNYTLIGSWMIGDAAAGIGIREDDSPITKDSSRFLPHIIID